MCVSEDMQKIENNYSTFNLWWFSFFFFQVWKPRWEAHPSLSAPPSSLWSSGTLTAITITSVWWPRKSSRSGTLSSRTVSDTPMMVSDGDAYKCTKQQKCFIWLVTDFVLLLFKLDGIQCFNLKQIQTQGTETHQPILMLWGRFIR